MSIDTGVKRVDSNVQVSIDTSVKGCRAGGLKFTTWKRDHTTQYSLAAVSQRSVAPWAWRKPQSRSPVEQCEWRLEGIEKGRLGGYRDLFSASAYPRYIRVVFDVGRLPTPRITSHVSHRVGVRRRATAADRTARRAGGAARAAGAGAGAHI